MADARSRVIAIEGSGVRAEHLAAACRAAGWPVRRGVRDGSVAEVGEPWIVIELVTLDRAAMERTFRELDATTPADSVLAASGSQLWLEACARATRRPDRVIGLHFMEPSREAPIVELVVTEQTSPTVLDEVASFISSLGMTAVSCADAPGFIVGRVARPYMGEALRMLEAGQGRLDTTDAALREAGYAQGPLRLIDEVGLDVDLAAAAALHEAFDEALRFRPSDLERDLVRAGRLGRERGRGFYRYDASGDAVAVDVDPRPGERLSGEAIVERIELALINEAYRAVDERVATPPEVDRALRVGLGFPRGPFERVDQLGLRHVVARLRVLSASTAVTSGDQYEVAALLWQMATV